MPFVAPVPQPLKRIVRAKLKRHMIKKLIILICILLSVNCAFYLIPRPHPNGEKWPKTVGAAVDILLKEIPDSSKQIIKDTPEDSLGKYHLTLGMSIRNNFGLWRGNSLLLLSSGCPMPDCCSTIIIKRLWKKLQNQ